MQNGLLRFPFQREGAPESYNFHGQDHWLPAGQGRGMPAVTGRRPVWFRDCGSIQRPSDLPSERFASVQLCGIKSSHSYFVQSSPPSFPRTFPASQAATLPPLDTEAPSVSPQPPPHTHHPTSRVSAPEYSGHLVEVGLLHYLSFCAWLLSLSGTSSRFTRAVVSEFPSF